MYLILNLHILEQYTETIFSWNVFHFQGWMCYTLVLLPSLICMTLIGVWLL